MIRSMTGYGQSSRSADGYRIQLEMKSVNHRYSEITVRMPREWLRHEEMLKKTVQQVVRRGRVDIFITIDRVTAAPKRVDINWDLAQGMVEASEQLQERFGFPDRLTLRELLAIPDLVQLSDSGENAADRVGEELRECLLDALQQLMEMRQQEGANLQADLSAKLAVLVMHHADIARISPLAMEEHRAKLRQRIQDLLGDAGAVDEHRLAMECAVQADKMSIDEELTRLESHFGQFGAMLQEDEPVGRKLDFLIQEMNREINTIGSKANHLELVNRVVDLKAELEKMREQVQNIE